MFEKGHYSVEKWRIDISILSQATPADLSTLIDRVIGYFGRYQIFLFVVLMQCEIFVSISQTGTAFFTFTPKNYSCTDDENTEANWTCVPGCLNYDFDDPDTSAVTAWSLVCDRSYLGPLVSTVNFAGGAVGSVFCGWWGDKRGRKRVLIIVLYMQGIVGVCFAIASYFELYMFLRFARGFFIQGLQGVSYTLIKELSPPRLATEAGHTYLSFWGIGSIFVGVVAYLSHDWQFVHTASAILTATTLLWSWTLPESPKWLLSQNRRKAAIKEAFRIAARNGDHDFFDKCCDLQFKVIKAIEPGYVPIVRKRVPATEKLSDLFTNRILLKHTLAMILIFFSGTLMYFEELYYMPDFLLGRQINFIIGGGVEVISCVLSYFAVSSFGRRNSLITYFYISSVLCLILAGFTFVEMDDYMVVVVQGIVALLAKGISIGTLATIFIYGAELFPTVLRSTAMGIVGLAARVASMIAPSFTLLGEISHPAVPMVIVSIVTFLSAYSTFNLPETLHKPLPNNLVEVEQLWGSKRERTNYQHQTKSASCT